ncbi:MAG: Ldh family oxidoreductase [Planctomycetes bacterium]|jgi:LDH2 family malate/lactate/ureidoglycolate dehydrogenase|nr:Ldh family oxidoreductase [Planctomycetota bacterium]HPY74063.1 Ldh family oxidoreductase [Planctomycetota bacterium]HQA99609.1 Ldh family oxidoreductase [Planctomycetota bacterium]
MDILVQENTLRTFVEQVFETLQVSPENAKLCADNLIVADLRGIHSHGVARLKRYVDGIQTGLMFPQNQPTIERETPSTANVNGNACLGQIIGNFSTKLAIQKAKNTGVGIVTAHNSNHYGIAGYYTMQILQENMIGLSMTNSAPLVVPTFGKDMMLGTNPISMAAPTKNKIPFVLDMATSVVPRGKLEVYSRQEKPLPAGWAVDETGCSSSDATHILRNMAKTIGGGILPLGGEGELFSGHKGYGLALLVEILTGVLSGGATSNQVYGVKNAPPDVSHIFIALKIENFIDLPTFQTKLDDLIERLQNSQKAQNQDHIYIHGEKEHNLTLQYKQQGIPISDKVYTILKKIAQDLQIQIPF